MADKETNFLKANVRRFETTGGKEWFNIDINVEDLKRFPVNEYWQAKLTMRPRKEPWKYGETHFLVENDFVPQKQEETKAVNPADDGDLPF